MGWLIRWVKRQQKQIFPSTPKPIVRKWIISPGGGWVHKTLKLLPPANEVWGKVIFLHLFVILFTRGGGGQGGGIAACIAGGIRACLAAGGVCSSGRCLVRGVGVPGGDPPDQAPPGRLLLRAVRILLECILVWFLFVLLVFVNDKNLMRFINKINGLGSVHSKSEIFL